MRRIKKQLKSILILSACIALNSIDSVALAENAEPALEDAHHHAQTNVDWPGIYQGFTPCADCMGIKTSLALNKNNTYVLITQFAGKSEREFVEKGKFAAGISTDILVLTPRDNSAVRQYQVGKDMMVQLDNQGNRYTGKNADRYILHRKDTASEKTQSHH